MRNSSNETLTAGGITLTEAKDMAMRLRIEDEILVLTERVPILTDTVRYTCDPIVRELAQRRLDEAQTRLAELKLIR